MPELFHVTDGPPLEVFRPRPSPVDSSLPGQELVWAVDAAHLGNYLLPRDCPRVCWATRDGAGERLGSPHARVVVIEHAWFGALQEAALSVHRLDPRGFECIDAGAGYWVSEIEVPVMGVETVDDCAAALAERGVELRVVASLTPYVDAVSASHVEFSVIRLRNPGRPPQRHPRRWVDWSNISDIFEGPGDRTWDADQELIGQSLQDPWERGS